MLRVIKKADIVLFCALLFSAAVSAAAFTMRLSAGPAAKVVITLDGQEHAVYTLDENREIEVTGDDFRNVILIDNGTVMMKFSDCHNQVCVEHAPISRSGESIICLPHKLVISIQGGKEADVDAIAR